jgi:hypothetical protein
MNPRLFCLCLVFPILAGCMHGSGGSAGSGSAHQPQETLEVSLPPTWQSGEGPKTGLSKSFEMLVFRGDQRVVLSVGRRPGKPEETLLQTRRMMTNVREEGINQIAGIAGEGVYAHGVDAEGKVVAYVLFNPQAGSKLQNYYLLGIFLAPDAGTEAEFEQVVKSIRIAGSAATATASFR